MATQSSTFLLEISRGYPVDVEFRLTDDTVDPEVPLDTTTADAVGLEIREKASPAGIAGVLVARFLSTDASSRIIPEVWGCRLVLTNEQSLELPDRVQDYDCELFIEVAGVTDSLGSGVLSLTRPIARPWETIP